MTGHQRVVVAALLLAAVLAATILVAFAGNACPVETPQQPCPDATRNLVIVIALAAIALALLVTPFSFLSEFVVRRRIVYRGAWWRAARRGALAGLFLASLAGLKLGDALSVPVAVFLIVLALIVERFLTARGV